MTPDTTLPDTTLPDTILLALQFLEDQVPFCQATVVAAGRDAGVTPGQKLLVARDDEARVTISGGLGSDRLTQAVAALALAAIDTGDVRLVHLTTDGDQHAERRARRGGDLEDDALEIALEPMLPPDRLLIVGAGHIAVPLSRLATITGFQVTVIDDRARFANRERFPDAAEIVVDDFEPAIARQRITPWTYLVLVTRGHEHDETTLRHVVSSPAPYIGMIGSRRRVLVVFQRLRAMGVPEQFLDRIYAPIGLDIGARTPEEIALAIMAEIINVKRRGKAPSLTHLLRRQVASLARNDVSV